MLPAPLNLSVSGQRPNQLAGRHSASQTDGHEHRQAKDHMWAWSMWEAGSMSSQERHSIFHSSHLHNSGKIRSSLGMS